MHALAKESRPVREEQTSSGSTGGRSLAARIPSRPTQGEIEASVCDGMRRFELEYVGRGPRDARAHLIGNLLLVCLTGVMTEPERRLVNSPDSRGSALVREMRCHLFEMARPLIEAMIEISTGVKVLSLHYDISMPTDEEAVLFTLAAVPEVRERDARRK